MDRDRDEKKKRMYKRLGIDFDQLLKNVFTTGAGKLRRPEYMMFWDQVIEKKNPSNFFESICNRLLEILQNKNPNGVSMESVVNTLNFVIFFLMTQFSLDPSKKLLEECKKNNYPQKFPAARDVIRLISLKTEQTKSEDLIGSLLISCSTLHSVDELQKLNDFVQNPTLDHSESRSGEACFIFAHLKDLCVEKKDRNLYKEIITKTVQKTLSLPSQMKMNPKLAETTLLALLHMLKQFICVAPFTDRQYLLKQAIPTIQQFYLWPCPFGSVTRDILQLLQKEAISPGAGLRSRIISESKKSAIKNWNSNPEGDGQDARPIYYIVEETDKRSSSFAFAMELQKANIDTKSEVDHASRKYRKAAQLMQSNQDNSYPALPPTTKAMILLCALKNEVGVTEEDLQNVKQLGESELNSVFEKLMSILDNFSIKPEQIQEVRSKGFAEVKNLLKFMAQAAVQAKKTPIKLPSKMGDSYEPSLPPIAHLVIPTQTTYPFLNKEQISLMCFTQTPFPSTPVVEALKQIFAEHEPLDEKTVSDVRIVLAGNDRLVHNFLCAYIHIMQSEETLLKGLNVKFFLLPFVKNHIASFLARHDSWYNRHIYVPFRASAFIFPWVNADEDPNNSEELVSALPPCVFFRRLVEDYVREAEVTCALNVYKCECWNEKTEKEKKQEEKNIKDGKESKEDEKCDAVIPLLQRFELGSNAFASAFRLKKNIPEDIKIDELMKDKTWQFNPPEMRIKFSRVDMNGKVLGGPIEDDPAPYACIVLSNVPQRGDRCFPPDPTAPWLEMHAASQRGFRPREMTKRSTLFSDPKQHINSLEVSVDTGTFSILVDGQCFGPYAKIRVSPIEYHGKRLTFPIQTFFPLEL